MSVRLLLLALVLAAGLLPAAEAVYVVRAGDTLTQIASAELGTATRYREIAELNALEPPYVLKVGQELRMPPLDPTDPLVFAIRDRLASGSTSPPPADDAGLAGVLDRGLIGALVAMAVLWLVVVVVDALGLQLGAWLLERPLTWGPSWLAGVLLAALAVGGLLVSLGVQLATRPLVWPTATAAAIFAAIHLVVGWVVVDRGLQAGGRLATVLLILVLVFRTVAIGTVGLIWV